MEVDIFAVFFCGGGRGLKQGGLGGGEEELPSFSSLFCMNVGKYNNWR